MFEFTYLLDINIYCFFKIFLFKLPVTCLPNWHSRIRLICQWTIIIKSNYIGGRRLYSERYIIMRKINLLFSVDLTFSSLYKYESVIVKEKYALNILLIFKHDSKILSLFLFYFSVLLYRSNLTHFSLPLIESDLVWWIQWIHIQSDVV